MRQFLGKYKGPIGRPHDMVEDSLRKVLVGEGKSGCSQFC